MIQTNNPLFVPSLDTGVTFQTEDTSQQCETPQQSWNKDSGYQAPNLGAQTLQSDTQGGELGNNYSDKFVS